MAENLDHRQLIDDYLSDNITIESKAVVEHKIATDPEFKSEFELQKNIVNAIKTTRRLELKSRLGNVHVPWYQTLPNTWKVAATVTVASLTVISAYFYFIDGSLQTNKLNLTTNETVDLTTGENVIPSKPNVVIKEIPEETGQPPVDLQDEGNKKPIEKPTARAEKSITTSPAVSQSEEELEMPEANREVEVVIPDVVDEFEGAQDLNLEEATEDNLNHLNPVREDLYSKTEVKTIHHKKYNFHYKLSEGLLTLYGNFEDIPYEILEINSSDGKRLFLNYKNNYYMLINTGEITPLTPVTDTALINELEIVKNNK
jgi:hypothetical protein